MLWATLKVRRRTGGLEKSITLDSVNPYVRRRTGGLENNLKSISGKPDVISQWIGHYITGFDLRFLWQRCVVNEVKPTVDIPYDAKPWGDKVFDTKVAWSGSGQYSGKSSLNALCNGFGFAGKGDLDGSKIFDAWLDGRYAEIAEYNKDDVNKCRLIYRKLNFIGLF